MLLLLLKVSVLKNEFSDIEPSLLDHAWSNKFYDKYNKRRKDNYLAYNFTPEENIYFLP